jgi:hypothetical protein
VELMLLLLAVSWAEHTTLRCTAGANCCNWPLAAGCAPMRGAAMTLFQKKRLSARAAMLLDAVDGLASTSASAWHSHKHQQQLDLGCGSFVAVLWDSACA